MVGAGNGQRLNIADNRSNQGGLQLGRHHEVSDTLIKLSKAGIHGHAQAAIEYVPHHVRSGTKFGTGEEAVALPVFDFGGVMQQAIGLR